MDERLNESSPRRSTLSFVIILALMVIGVSLLLTLLSVAAYSSIRQQQQQSVSDSLQAKHIGHHQTKLSQLTQMAKASVQAFLQAPDLAVSTYELSRSLALIEEQAAISGLYVFNAAGDIVFPKHQPGLNLLQRLRASYPNLQLENLADRGAFRAGGFWLQLEPVHYLAKPLGGLAVEVAVDRLDSMKVPVAAPLHWSWWLGLFALVLASLAAVVYCGYVLLQRQYKSLPAVCDYASALAADETSGALKLEPGSALIPLAASLSRVAENLQMQDQRFDQLRFCDPLTGLANRHQFSLWLQELVLRHQREDSSFALLLLNLDQFKRVNDSLGHDSGDELLAEMAERLSDLLEEYQAQTERVESTNSPAYFLARFNGGEFGILLPQHSVDSGVNSGAASMAQSIQSMMIKRFHNGDRELQLSASIGISLCPQDGDEAAQLLKNAELAMYQAKSDGQNAYQFFAEFMSVKAIKRLNIEVELRHALEHNELRLFYQPKFDVEQRVMVGCEALLRWQHPQRGIIGPDYFLDVAEQTGLIGPIGQWVSLEVCRQLQQWQGTHLQLLPVAFNISAAEFQLRDVVADLHGSLIRHEVNSALVQLEVTETTIASNEAKVGRDLERLRSLGVKVWIDDFGTGYSSLGYLRRFAVDGVKIDRSFVQEVADNPADAALCGAIVAMASQLKLDVVAEGVEDRKQFDLLQQSGCAQAQGFFYARPMSPEVLSKQAGHLLQLGPISPAEPLAQDYPPHSPFDVFGSDVSEIDASVMDASAIRRLEQTKESPLLG